MAFDPYGYEQNKDRPQPGEEIKLSPSWRQPGPSSNFDPRLSSAQFKKPKWNQPGGIADRGIDALQRNQAFRHGGFALAARYTLGLPVISNRNYSLFKDEAMYHMAMTDMSEHGEQETEAGE